MPESRKKILIVKIGAIGDVVMALPMITAIDRKYPGAEITWLCGKIVEPVLLRIKRIDKVITVNDKELLIGNTIDKIKALIGVWKKLREYKFDIIFNAHRDKRYKLLTIFQSSGDYWDLSGGSRISKFIPLRYQGVEYSKMITRTDNWAMEELAFPTAITNANETLANKIKKLKKPIVILNPGGAKNLLNGGEVRRWPIEYYVRLSELLILEGYTIILIGAPQDSWISEYFKDKSIIDLVGNSSLEDLIEIYNNSDILISHDTGPMHIAKLTGIKVIALFGPVNPRMVIGKNENFEVIWLGDTLPCSPCYDGKSFADCNNNICMKNIPVDLVYDKVKKMIDNTN